MGPRQYVVGATLKMLSFNLEPSLRNASRCQRLRRCSKDFSKRSLTWTSIGAAVYAGRPRSLSIDPKLVAAMCCGPMYPDFSQISSRLSSFAGKKEAK